VTSDILPTFVTDIKGALCSSTGGGLLSYKKTRISPA